MKFQIIRLNLIIILTLGLLLFTRVLARSISPDQLFIELGPAVVRQSLPGEVIILAFKVSNHGCEQLSASQEVVLPPGWQLLIPPAEFTLTAGSDYWQFFSIHIGGKTEVGFHTVQYKIKQPGSKTTLAAEKVTVEVLPQYGLDLFVQTVPPAVLAGESYQLNLLVINQSNVSLEIMLTAAGNQDNPVYFSQTIFLLEAQQTQRVTVTVKTAADNQKYRTQRLLFKAAGITEQGEQLITTTRTEVALIPYRRKSTAYYYLPAELRGTFAFRQDLGLQLELAGSGNWSGSKTQYLSFFSRLPALPLSGTNFPHKETEYYLNYRNPGLTIIAGDQTFSLTPSDKKRVVGRGVKITTHRGDGELTAYYRPPVVNQKPLLGFLASYGSDNYQIGLGYQQTGSGNQRETTYLLETHREQKQWQAELEISHKLPAGRNYLRGLFSGSRDWLQYSGEHYFSDSNFNPAGIPNNVSRLLLEIFPENQFSLKGEYTGKKEPEKQENYRLELITRGNNGQFSLAYRQNNDGYFFKDYNKKQSYWQLNWQYPLGNWGGMIYRTYWENDYSSLSQQFTDSLQIKGNYQIQPGWEIRGEYRLSNLLADSIPEFRLALRSRYNLADRGQLNLTFNYRNTKNQAASGQIGAELSLKTVNEPDINFKFRADYNQNHSPRIRGQIALQLTDIDYFKIPVGRKEGTLINGYLYEQQKKQSLKNVIVRVDGQAVATDSEGRFGLFLEPGSYYLTVDRQSLPSGMIIREELPLLLEIEAQQREVDLELAAVREAKLVGGVTVINPEDNNNNRVHPQQQTVGRDFSSFLKPEPVISLSGLKIMLIDNQQKIITQKTNNRGQFFLSGLKPGKYQLTICPQSLPDGYRMEDFTPELEPGEIRELNIPLLWAPRRVEFIDQGVLQ